MQHYAVCFFDSPRSAQEAERMSQVCLPPLRIFSLSWIIASVPCAQQEPQYCKRGTKQASSTETSAVGHVT